MDEKNILLHTVVKSLKERDLDLEEYRIRLKYEVYNLTIQGEFEYLMNLHRKFKNEGLIFPCNENNSLVDFLLDLTDEFDINEEPVHVMGEMPDIDIDFIKPVRDYLKGTWAAETFGQDYICEIGTYGTSGIKSAILDMARVHGADFNEIQSITTTMVDKDDEGKSLEWDKAIEMYPEFKDYCEKYANIADAAKLLQRRNAQTGVHAGGLIISSKKIDEFVPLEVRKVNKENPDGIICSAWTEGLAQQDLQPVGLIKFDLLVINNLLQIALACSLIKSRHNLKGISAREGKSDWTDLSYLEDPLSIEMANKGDLKCIFQFDGEGIQKLVKRGGVTRFDDIIAYSSLYRPGCLTMGMDVKYCKRKAWAEGDTVNGEPYNIHPLLEKSLSKTYNVMLYQEQIMDILKLVGNIPDMHTEKVRKAISKKKVKDFIGYKQMFIENGQKNLETTKEKVEELWQQVEAFSEYGFNKSLDQDTIIPTTEGYRKISEVNKGDFVYCINADGDLVTTEILQVHDHGVLNTVEIEFDDGYKVVSTMNHKYLTKNGQMSLDDIIVRGLSVLSDDQFKAICSENEGYWEFGSMQHRIDVRDESATFDLDHAPISDTSGLVDRKIVRLRSVGKRQTYDLEVENSTHNFLLPNGIVTSNSHACAYSYISSRLLWLKSHYPLEFYAGTLMCQKDTEKFKECKIDATKHNVDVMGVDINKSKANFTIVDDVIYFGFQNIKGIGSQIADDIVKYQPYKNFIDFLNRFGTCVKTVKPLISLGVFDQLEPTRNHLYLRKMHEFYKDKIKKRTDRQSRFAKSMVLKDSELRELVLTEISDTDPDFDLLCDFENGEAKREERLGNIFREIPYTYKGENRTRTKSVAKLCEDLRCKKNTSVRRFEESEKDDDDESSFSYHDSRIANISLSKEEEVILNDYMIVNESKTYPMAEKLYYGFVWRHELETCPDFEGYSVDTFMAKADIEGHITAPIEVKILKVEERKSKRNVVFYTITMEDVNSKELKVNIWSDDWAIWNTVIVPGALLRMRLKPPSGGYSTFNFDSYQRHLRPKDLNVDNDHRIKKLTPPDYYKKDEDVLFNIDFKDDGFKIDK